MNARVLLAIAATALGAAAAPLAAQTPGAPAAGYSREAGLPAATLPAPLREIGFDQKLESPLPLDLSFNDEHGRSVRLGEYFGRKPVVLAFVYYDCPMLCTLVLNALARSLDVLSLEPGRDFEIVTISFDPRERPALAAAKKAAYLQRYRRAGADDAWHFLTGDQAAIDRAAKAAGFRFVWDERLKQFAHPTGVIVLTPDGRVARYLFGIEYGPRDLRFAIVDASAGKVGSKIDAVLLYCYHYDPMTGRYGLVVMRAMRLAGAATVLALAGFVGVMLRREHLARRTPHALGTPHPAPRTAPGTSHPARGTR